jgi:hypothetical protein
MDRGLYSKNQETERGLNQQDGSEILACENDQIRRNVRENFFEHDMHPAAA